MIEVIIPLLPPKALSPNSRSHWATKARASKESRKAAWVCAQTTKGEGLSRFIRAKLKITVYVKDKRYIADGDNAIAMNKPFIDGCVDVGIVPDDSPDHLTIEGIEYIVDAKEAPKTVLKFIGDSPANCEGVK